MSAVVDFLTSPLFFNILPFAAVAVILVFLFRLYLRVRARRIQNLTYRRSFSPDGVHAGDSVTLTEIIENPSFLPAFFVDVGSYYPDGLMPESDASRTKSGMYYYRSRFSLMPRSRVTRTHTIICPKRGFYKIDTAEIFDGIDYIYISAPAELWVYPEEKNDFPEPLFNNIVSGEFSNLRRFVPDPFALSGLRSYRVGDPMSSVNFKASARNFSGGMPDLVVNERDSSSRFDLMIYYNFNIPRETGIDGEEGRLLCEAGLSYCASLLEKSLFGGDRIGFSTNGVDRSGERYCRFLPDGGYAHVKEILKSMADIELREGASFPALLDMDMASGSIGGSDVCIITFYVDEEINGRVETMRRNGINVNMLILPTYSDRTS